MYNIILDSSNPFLRYLPRNVHSNRLYKCFWSVSQIIINTFTGWGVASIVTKYCAIILVAPHSSPLTTMCIRLYSYTHQERTMYGGSRKRKPWLLSNGPLMHWRRNSIRQVYCYKNDKRYRFVCKMLQIFSLVKSRRKTTKVYIDVRHFIFSN